MALAFRASHRQHLASLFGILAFSVFNWLLPPERSWSVVACGVVATCVVVLGFNSLAAFAEGLYWARKHAKHVQEVQEMMREAMLQEAQGTKPN